MTKAHETFLIIPDAHAMPGVNSDRFKWAGMFAAHKEVDRIICLGDWAEMGAISHYDKNTKKAEGKRVVDDIKAAVEAQEVFFKEINRHKIALKKQGKPDWKLTTYMCLGNHEIRLDKAANKDPEFYGLISTKSLRYEEFWDHVIPFLEPLTINGVSFCHYWPNAMGRPINSVNSIMSLPGGSKVSGHTHTWDQRRDGRISPKIALIAGCYLDHAKQIKGNSMDYASVFQRQAWFNGLFLLNEVREGSCLPVPVTYDYLKKTYGKS